jgi:hypothetical protein
MDQDASVVETLGDKMTLSPLSVESFRENWEPCSVMWWPSQAGFLFYMYFKVLWPSCEQQ